MSASALLGPVGRSGGVQRPLSASLGSPRRPRLLQPARRNPPAERSATALPAAASATTEQHLGGSVDWAVEVTRHTLTMPQLLQHLEQMERMEAVAAARRAAAAAAGAAPARPPSTREQHTVSWVEHSTSSAASLMEGVLSDSEDDSLDSLAALPPHLLTDSQRAAVVLAAWAAAAHTKPADFDAGTQLTMPGLADVAVVSRGGWQRHAWKSSNQDAFLALPLAAGSAACQGCPSSAACCSAAVAIGVFDGHGRAGGAASAHLRNALASGLLMHSQLALMAQPACQRGQHERHALHGSAASPAPAGGAGEGDAAGEAAALLERCFAAAASTMPSTGADFSLSGSTAVMCLIQPGSVTAAWAGDSRAVLGLHKDGRYIACALTRDHKPSSPLERARIEQAGGWVMQTLLDEEGRPAGPHRVYLPESNIPGLAVSRCFGDFVAASAGLTSTPDVTTLVLPGGGGGGGASGPAPAQHGRRQQRQPRGSTQQQPRQKQCSTSKGRGVRTPRDASPNGQNGQQQQQRAQRQRQRGSSRAGDGQPGASEARHVLIVASDGLWEFVSNADAVRIASRCPTAQLAADCLTLEAQAQWAVRFGGQHCDDITVAVAFLPDRAR
ncbi:hypothetical protein ABPG75_005107 [Micractinium tetrahymenae]